MAKPRCRMHPEGIGKESMAVACQETTIRSQPRSPIMEDGFHGEGLRSGKIDDEIGFRLQYVQTFAPFLLDASR